MYNGVTCTPVIPYRWPTPSNVKQIQSFIGFANFYCRFIVNFSEMVAPLTRLT